MIWFTLKKFIYPCICKKSTSLLKLMFIYFLIGGFKTKNNYEENFSTYRKISMSINRTIIFPKRLIKNNTYPFTWCKSCWSNIYYIAHSSTNLTAITDFPITDMTNRGYYRFFALKENENFHKESRKKISFPRHI